MQSDTLRQLTELLAEVQVLRHEKIKLQRSELAAQERVARIRQEAEAAAERAHELQKEHSFEIKQLKGHDAALRQRLQSMQLELDDLTTVRLSERQAAEQTIAKLKAEVAAHAAAASGGAAAAAVAVADGGVGVQRKRRREDDAEAVEYRRNIGQRDIAEDLGARAPPGESGESGESGDVKAEGNAKGNGGGSAGGGVALPVEGSEDVRLPVERSSSVRACALQSAAPAPSALAAPAPSALVLRPCAQDGRKDVRLDLGESTPLILGRASKDQPNPWGVSDPRVSRKHLRLAATREGRAACMTALGSNPVGVYRNDRLFKVEKGEAEELHDGDVLALVLEDSIPGVGPSSFFRGNPCAYYVIYDDGSNCEAHPYAVDAADAADAAPTPFWADTSSSGGGGGEEGEVTERAERPRPAQPPAGWPGGPPEPTGVAGSDDAVRPLRGPVDEDADHPSRSPADQHHGSSLEGGSQNDPIIL